MKTLVVYSTRYQKRSDLLKALKESKSLSTEACFLPSLFLPRIGFSSFFNTLWNPDPPPPPRWRGPCIITWFTRGIGATPMSRGCDFCNFGSERLRPNITLLSCAACASNDSLSNSSNKPLCWSPNLVPTTSIFLAVLPTTFAFSVTLLLTCL